MRHGELSWGGTLVSWDIGALDPCVEGRSWAAGLNADVAGGDRDNLRYGERFGQGGWDKSMGA